MRLTWAEVRIDLADIREYDRAFRFYAAIMDVQAECKRLWAYLRWLDRAGSGCATIDVSIAARFLKCGKSTIYRMLAQGSNLTNGVRWFNGRSSAGCGVIKIWYASTVNVFKGLGLECLGALSEVPIDALTRSGAKFTATELTALHRQRQAHFAVRATNKDPGIEIREPWLQSPSVISAGVMGVVVREGVIVPAASIKGIASATQWSEYTTRRRLTNKVRLVRGFTQIGKCPTYIRDIGDNRFIQLDRFLRDNKQTYKVYCEDGAAYRLINNLAFRIGPNIYREDYQLMSCRHLRSRCAKAISKANTVDALVGQEHKYLIPDGRAQNLCSRFLATEFDGEVVEFPGRGK
jgi:hypothetical protein